MSSKLVGVSASDLEDVKMDEPIMLTSAKVSATIIGGENIWKQPNIPIDTLFHWGPTITH